MSEERTIRIPLKMTIMIDRNACRHGDVVLETAHVEYGDVPFDAVFSRQLALLETIARSRGDTEVINMLCREAGD